MDIKIIYEDADVLVVDKPAGVVVFPEGEITGEKTLIDLLLEKYPALGEIGSPPRYGVVHRLDKDTSGILLVAKNSEALIFFQKQFKSREVEKRYVTLVTGKIKDDEGKIETLISRSPADPRKQKAYDVESSSSYKVKRRAVTEYKVIKRFEKYTLLEVTMKTGRKHQIRCHMAYIHHPIAGDKLYGFKDSSSPEGLTRQFLHASYLKIRLPNGEINEFESELPKDLQQVLDTLQ